MSERKIELLSPAKNATIGIAAINHGADAVYIGPERFGARVAAGNSVAQIEELVKYAHKYYAKVYVTLNTILYDNELDEAQLLINRLYNAGVDALIIQDMALLELDLPPIALHASTQCNNRTAEQVRFLEQCGFEQVVLARELSLKEISNIYSQTNATLEGFIHGALCVSYSGQCYMSEALCGRSANRGACAQMCRLPYTLTDDKGIVLAKDKHLLSLKDFDASAHIREMIDAGISSFKIEGRLKDDNYVKNITAYYRRKLDAILESDKNLTASSSGKTTFFFTPDPQKTFYRGATDYFLTGRKRDIWSFDTPKSLGEPLGRVKDVWRNAFSLEKQTDVTNGDGLCFINGNGELEGFRINKTETGRLLPLQMPKLTKGTLVYRNSDTRFEKILNSKTSERKIPLKIRITEKEEGFIVSITDSDNITTSTLFNYSSEPAKNAGKAKEAWISQFNKLGNTDFVFSDMEIYQLPQPKFVPISQIGEWRRQVIEQHTDNRGKNYRRSERKILPTTHKYPVNTLSYKGNVANKTAEKFYQRHGVEKTAPAFEISHTQDVELMRTKHCIRYAMNLCPKHNKEKKDRIPEHLYLENSHNRFELTFDCKNCEMVIKRV